jgi:NitT/TauT family transport system substrate-binding protein
MMFGSKIKSRGTAFIAVLLSALLALGALAFSSGCGQSDDTTGASAGGNVTINVASLKGPTSIGLADMMDNPAGQNGITCNYDIETQADVIAGKLAQGSVDIALIPANLAATLYNKTAGSANALECLDINTLGVLYLVGEDQSVRSMSGLKGRTVYLTGKGTTPEYAVNYLLGQSGLKASDVDLEYLSEAQAVVAKVSSDRNALAILPEPFVSSALAKVPGLQRLLSLNYAWQMAKASNGSELVTGVTVARKAFIDAHPEAVAAFMAAQASSVQKASVDPASTAQAVVANNVLPITDVNLITAAIPFCSLAHITGTQMRTALSGYLKVLYKADPSSVGGKLPDYSKFLYQG